MASRQDQLQSYQFLLQRVVSALVYRKTDPAQSPFRRAGGAVFAGVMLSILALAVTAAIGLFANIGKKTNWWEGGVVIMEEETGAAYVVFPPKKQASAEYPPMLYPVENFASAALLAGTTATISVNQRSLTGEDMDTKVPPRGMKVGIPGAPLSLPSADNLISQRHWTVCSDPNSEDPESLLYVGELLTDGSGLGADEGLLITDGDKTYLVGGNGYKHLVLDTENTLGALSLSGINRPVVAPALAKALPSGDDLVVPQINALGDDSDFGEAKVGDVFQSVAGDNTQYLVAMPDGTAPISELQAYLISKETGDGFITGNQASEAAAAIKEKHRYRFLPDSTDKAAVNAALPAQSPTVPTDWHTGAACVAFDGDTATLRYKTTLPVNPGISTSRVSETDGTTFADRIVVVPGRGMLVSTGSGTEGAVSLITSEGQYYPLATDQGGPPRNKIVAPKAAKEALGYADVQPIAIGATLLSLIPEGVALDPQKAIETAIGTVEVPE